MQATNRFCVYCGNPLGPEARFCGSCGQQVPVTPDASNFTSDNQSSISPSSQLEAPQLPFRPSPDQPYLSPPQVPQYYDPQGMPNQSPTPQQYPSQPPVTQYYSPQQYQPPAVSGMDTHAFLKSSLENANNVLTIIIILGWLALLVSIIEYGFPEVSSGWI
jgi:hypothetical protein